MNLTSKILNDSINNCIIDFNILLNINKYISKREYNKFIESYKDIIINIEKLDYIKNNGEMLIKKHNQDFINKNMVKLDNYFNNILCKIDSNIKLDENQRKAILIDEDYSLIVAGAGAGKTTTMAAKVKYLIDKCYIKPNEIIILAFTNKASEELDYKVNEQLKLNVEVLTFHKLAMKFLREIGFNSIQIITNKDIYNIINEYVKEYIFKNKIILEKFSKGFNNYLPFDDRSMYFEDFNDYYQNFTHRKYHSLSKTEIKSEINKLIDNRIKEYKTIKGEYLKSEDDVKIANYLYIRSIPYTYEMPYNNVIKENIVYIPKFTIHTLSGNIYIEYYDFAKKDVYGNITSIVKNYVDVIYKNREIHYKFKTDLIELFGSYKSTFYLDELGIELAKRNISKLLKSDMEIFYTLMETSKDDFYIKFNNLMLRFINIFKEMNYHLTDFESLILKTKDKNLKIQLKFTKEIYNYYQKNIYHNNKIDFYDMINYSYENMEKITLSHNYKYIIIDEYQDISHQRYNFIKKLSDLFKAKIIAVGDDYQSIYSFSGSDVSLFSSFIKIMGYGEIIKINNTYRNSQELIDLAGEFVSKNKMLISKSLHSNKRLEKPIELIYYKFSEIAKKVNDIIYLIYINNRHSTILLLGRYKSDIDNILSPNFFKRGEENTIISNSVPNAKIDFLTIHASKGLGYDNVILLNVLDDIKGFPSKITTPPLIKLLNKNENNRYEEERRLFYVALTRTKNKIYIMCPYNYKKLSIFIKEIINNINVIEKY